MKQEVAVIGAGVVGLTLSVWLAKSGFSLSLFDKSKIQEKALTEFPATRVIALNPASIALLDALGVWPDVKKERLLSYDKMQVWDAMSKGEISFHASELHRQSLGVIIEEQVIKNALISHLSQYEKVHLIKNADISEVSAEKMEIWQQGQPYSFSAIFAADGANSLTRCSLKIPASFAPYGHESIVCTLRHQDSHQHSAKQVFTPDGPLAFLPLYDEHLSSIVYSLSPQKAARLKAMDNDEFIETLNDAFLHKVKVTHMLTERISFPLTRRHAKNYIKNKVVLLGDAVCGIHPLAGQGMNLGLNEVSILKSLYESQANTFLTERTFSQYERQAKWHNQKMLAGMDFFKNFFSKNNKLPAPLVRFGMKLINDINPIKQQLIKLASGL